MENFMRSKLYESTGVDRRTWLYLPSSTSGEPAETVSNSLKYKKEFF